MEAPARAYSKALSTLLLVQLVGAGGCLGELGDLDGEAETLDQQDPPAAPAEDNKQPVIIKPPVIIVSIPSTMSDTSRSTQFIKSVFEEQEYQVIAVIEKKGAALVEHLQTKKWARKPYLVFINNHGFVGKVIINGHQVARHLLEDFPDQGGAVTKEDIMDPLNDALGVENLVYYVGACHAGQVTADYQWLAKPPAIIPESRAEIPSTGFTAGFEGGDVQQLFLKMLPRGSPTRAAADANQDGLITVRELREYINKQGILGNYGGDPFSMSNPGLYMRPVYLARQIIPTIGRDDAIVINNQLNHPSSLDKLSFVTPSQAVAMYESSGFKVEIVEHPTYDEHARLYDEMMQLEP